MKHLNPLQSHSLFEKAFKIFMAEGAAEGSYLAWAGIVEVSCFAFDGFDQTETRLSLLNELVDKFKGFPSDEIEGNVATMAVHAALLKGIVHPDLERWSEKSFSLRERLNGPSRIILLMNLAVLGLWRGDFCMIENSIKALQPFENASEFARVLKSVLGLFAFVFFGHGTSRDGLDVAAITLEFSESTGIHVWDGLVLEHASIIANMSGDYAAAGRWLALLEKLSSTAGPWAEYCYHFASSFDALVSRDLPKAEDQCGRALVIAEKLDVRWARLVSHRLMCLILTEERKLDLAQKHISSAIGVARKENLPYFEFFSRFVEAYHCLKAGQRLKAIGILRGTLSWMRGHGVFNCSTVPFEIQALLLTTALDEGIETDYVREYICRRGIPPLPDSVSEKWPWPLKIYTMGRFVIEKGGKPLMFAGKLPRKPLAVLKAVIASSGKASITKLSDELWPEVEGDAARRSCDIALYRLRQIIGVNGAITTNGGSLGLTPRFVWVDAWALDNLLEQAGMLKGGNGSARARGLADEAIGLYKGHFLPDDDEPWTAAMRERLRAGFLRLLAISGKKREFSSESL